MNAVDVSHVSRSFAGKKAVDDLTFSVGEGEILGLIGPNGAGKTTTIRMVMDITRPDKGDVTILGVPCGPAARARLGYLPEERGLYRKARVMDCIVYLASLVGMRRVEAEKKADELLERTGMLHCRDRRIETLSKGMGQIIQFIVAIVHDPRIVIMDEPFSGLDPVNVELLKGVLGELKGQGKAIILSTHAMNDVEELCDRVLMINGGRAILYGDLREIRSRYRTDSVLLDVEGDIGEIPGVASIRARRGHTELVLNRDASSQEILECLVAHKRVIRHFEAAVPSLTDVFLKALDGQGEREEERQEAAHE